MYNANKLGINSLNPIIICLGWESRPYGLSFIRFDDGESKCWGTSRTLNKSAIMAILCLILV